MPDPYIIDQTEQNPTMEITLPEVSSLFSVLHSKAIIYRFNGYWLKPEALYQWVFSLSTPNCDIYLCSKGFFIVQFETQKDLDFVLNEGPWIWGWAGVFITPWFPEFDATTMVGLYHAGVGETAKPPPPFLAS